MFGTGTPYRSMRSEIVTPVVASFTSSSAERRIALSAPTWVTSFCASLISSASWSVPAKMMITLVISGFLFRLRSPR